MGEKHSKHEVYETAVEVARYYGFSSLDETISAYATKQKKLRIPHQKEDTPGEINRPTLMKALIDAEAISGESPIMIYHTEGLRKFMDRTAYGGKDAVLFALEIIGVPRSIAEALLFKTALTILEELGFDNLAIEINSLGDRESIARFTRDFTNYYKKHAEEIPTHCRTNLKKDIFKVLECTQDKCSVLKEHAPKPISSLTENSRGHFSQVLEFLESMDVPYNINNCLIGGKDYYTKTIFEIRTPETENRLFKRKMVDSVLARGGRYDDLAKTLGLKKEIPAVGITISLGGLPIIPPKKCAEDKAKRAKVYLIHLGFEAKIKSLHAIEVLRKGRIPVHQSLSRDRLSAQILSAETMRIPFMIIIGQKEALEGTAIVRNMKNRSQETVPILELPRFIKVFEKEV